MKLWVGFDSFFPQPTNEEIDNISINYAQADEKLWNFFKNITIHQPGNGTSFPSTSGFCNFWFHFLMERQIKVNSSTNVASPIKARFNCWTELISRVRQVQHLTQNPIDGRGIWQNKRLRANGTHRVRMQWKNELVNKKKTRKIRLVWRVAKMK